MRTKIPWNNYFVWWKMKTVQCRCKNTKAFVKSPQMSYVCHVPLVKPANNRNNCQAVIVFTTSCKMRLKVDISCAFLIFFDLWGCNIFLWTLCSGTLFQIIGLGTISGNQIISNIWTISGREIPEFGFYVKRKQNEKIFSTLVITDFANIGDCILLILIWISCRNLRIKLFITLSKGQSHRNEACTLFTKSQ